MTEYINGNIEISSDESDEENVNEKKLIIEYEKITA